MDKMLLKKTAMQSVALMLAVITLSYALRQYSTVTISASDLQTNEEAIISEDQEATSGIHTETSEDSLVTGNTEEANIGNGTSDNAPTKLITFPGMLQPINSDIVDQLGERFLVIKKPLGKELSITLEDLYMSKSIRLILSGLENSDIDSSYVGRINMEESFFGEPNYTEVISLEEDSDGKAVTVITKDFGNDIVHGISISNKLVEASGLFTGELLIELDNIYAHNLQEDETYYYIGLKNPKEVFDKVLVIDAGHGGKDAGALSKNELNYEKDINLKILLDLKELLDKENIKVYYTRLKDETVFLRPRVTLTNAVDSDFFVSIHCNANEVTGPNGTEILYYDTEFKSVRAKELAKLFSQEIAKATSLKNRGLVQMQKDDIFILENAVVPAVLIEVGYMSNQKDLEFLLKDVNRKAVAKGIYAGILRAYEALQ